MSLGGVSSFSPTSVQFPSLAHGDTSRTDLIFPKRLGITFSRTLAFVDGPAGPGDREGGPARTGPPLRGDAQSPLPGIRRLWLGR